MAQAPQGVMDILTDGIKVFSGPDFTLEVLRLLEMQVEDLRAGRVTSKEAAEKLSEAHPALGDQFFKWANLGVNFIIAMAAVAAAVFAWQAQPNSNRSVEEVAVEEFQSTYDAPQADMRWPRGSALGRSESSNASPSVPAPAAAQKPNRKQRRAAKARARRR